jgi:hypothetical protein
MKGGQMKEHGMVIAECLGEMRNENKFLIRKSEGKNTWELTDGKILLK